MTAARTAPDRHAPHAPFAPRARPAVAPQPPPSLRVVPDASVLRARRRVRLCTAIAGLVACFGLFGVVGVHVMLAQGQGEVQRLSSEVQEQEDAQRRLRLQVAELESPERIVAAARQQLGMTPPTTIVMLSPATLDDPLPTNRP